MEPFALPNSPNTEIARFVGDSVGSGSSWHTWIKPPGKSHAWMLVLGAGGGGGNGVIGANSTAGGGGGGGSGAMTIVEMPLSFLPPQLFISVGAASPGAGSASYISTKQNTTANHVIAMAKGGAVGADGVGATGGAAGAGGGAAAATDMALGWLFCKFAVAGSAGSTAGSTGNAFIVTLPATGGRVTGGSGGGGLSAAGTNGAAGGAINGPAGISYLPGFSVPGPTSATTPPTNGNNGIDLSNRLGFYYYGGLGSASTHGSATGTGLVQGTGGDGAIGCGGGGSGGALTGSTPANASRGGAGLVIIICS